MKDDFDRMDEYDEDEDRVEGMGCVYAFMIMACVYGIAYWIFA